MRARLFRVITRLEELGWKSNAPLVVVLNRIAEHEDPSVIEEIFEAFR